MAKKPSADASYRRHDRQECLLLRTFSNKLIENERTLPCHFERSEKSAEGL